MTLQRIIAEPSHDSHHWSAWFEDSPETAFGGDSPATAIERLVASAGIDPYDVEAESSESPESGRLVFSVRPKECPECGGSGKYVGMDVVEPCRACGGSGRAGGGMHGMLGNHPGKLDY